MSKKNETYIVRGSWGSGVVEMSDGDTFIKVITFPVPEDCSVAGESMWVILKDGDEFNGTGYLDNDPAFWDGEIGTLIRFEGGNTHYKPHFVEVVNGEEEE